MLGRLSVRPSVRPHTWNSAPAGRIFPKFCTDEFYKIVWGIQDWLIPKKNKSHFTYRPTHYAPL